MFILTRAVFEAGEVILAHGDERNFHRGVGWADVFYLLLWVWRWEFRVVMEWYIYVRCGGGAGKLDLKGGRRLRSRKRRGKSRAGVCERFDWKCGNARVAAS